MEWNNYYIDAILVPSAFAASLLYHAFLYYKVTRHPFETTCGINQKGRRLWVYCMIKDNDKKNVLAVQTLRNSIMESTLMGTTAVLLCAALAAYMSFTNSVKQPMDLSGVSNQISESTKCFLVLICFLLSFICHTQSIRFFNHVNYMINLPVQDNRVMITPEYVAELMERGTNYYSVGARIFYSALPLMLWVFGAIPVFISTLVIIRFLYNFDFVHEESKINGKILEQAPDLEQQNCSI